MDNDINKPITKETTLVQGCSTGHHTFGSNSMLAMHGGILEMRMKCSLCAAEIAEPIPGLASSIPQESLPKDDEPSEEGSVEKVPVPEKAPEPEVSFGDPMERLRNQPINEPPWADDVRNRYIQDKNLDNFWGNVWDKAKSK